MKRLNQSILLLCLLISLPTGAQKNEHAIAMQKAIQSFLQDKQVELKEPYWTPYDSARTEEFVCRGEEPIKYLLQNFMEHFGNASLRYCYSLPHEMETMKAVHIVAGSKDKGTDVWIPLYIKQNTYMIAYEDTDGLFYGFDLAWDDLPNGTKEGFVGSFIGYKAEFVTIINEEDRTTMDSVRTAIKIGEKVQNEQNVTKTEIDTTYIDGKWAVSTKFHRKILLAMDNISDHQDDFPALANKVKTLADFSKDASHEQLASIGFALKREASRYEMLLTPEQFALLWGEIYKMESKAKKADEQIQDYFKASENILREKINETVRLDYFEVKRHKFLQRTGFTVTKNEGGRIYFAVWGKHYTGNPDLEYLDACADEDGVLKYHAQHIEKGLKPGIYRLTAAGRTSYSGNTGAFIFAKTDKLLLKEIPACDDRGGDIWQQAALRVKEADEKGQQISPQDVRITLANGGMGYGWNRIVIDNIIVRDGTLIYGLSCDEGFTGKHFTGRWLSAVDFVLERTGDLPDK